MSGVIFQHPLEKPFISNNYTTAKFSSDYIMYINSNEELKLLWNYVILDFYIWYITFHTTNINLECIIHITEIQKIEAARATMWNISVQT